MNETSTQASLPIYIALQGMRAKLPDGTYRNFSPGEEIPPGTVEKWPNPGLWFKRGFIARKDGVPMDASMRGAYEPPRPVTDADLERVMAGSNTFEAGNGSPFPRAQPGDIGPGAGKPSAATDPSPQEMDRVPASQGSVSAAKIAELKNRSRSELVRMAEAKGLRVNEAENKDQIAKRLLGGDEKPAA